MFIVKAKFVKEALIKRHENQGTSYGLPIEIFLDELTTSTGLNTKDEEKENIRRLDGWAMRLVPPWDLIAYEIKVSKRDFLMEMSDPEKKKQALMYSNYFYIVTPKGLLNPHELPSEAGLIEVLDDGSTRVKVKAPYREATYPTWRFLASVLRRVYTSAYGLEEDRTTRN